MSSCRGVIQQMVEHGQEGLDDDSEGDRGALWTSHVLCIVIQINAYTLSHILLALRETLSF